jgi:hypothetical protein
VLPDGRLSSQGRILVSGDAVALGGRWQAGAALVIDSRSTWLGGAVLRASQISLTSREGDLDLTGAGSFWTSSWVPGNEVFTIDFSTGAIGLSPIIGLDPLDPAAPTTFRARLVRNAR